MFRISGSLLLLSLLVPSSLSLELARPVPQSLGSRANYEGSWALGIPGTECPNDTPVGCTQSSLSNLECCPSGNTCFGLSSSYCCPSKADCETTVRNFPSCFNETWQLYMYKSSPNYFCCPQGQFGVIPVNGYGGICQYSDVAVAASRLATLVETGPASRSTIVSTGRTTSTAVITSTKSDGAVVTITTEVAGKVTVTSTTGGASQESSSSSSSPGNSGGGSSPSSSSSKSASKDSLSAGAIAGIVIGSLGVIALFLVAFLLYRRSSRKGGAGHSIAPDTYPDTAQQQHGSSSAPVYTTVPQQNPHNYPTSASELKSPDMVGTNPENGGYLRPQDQHLSGTGTNAPGPLDQHPQGVYGNAVEAPEQNRWEGRAEMGPGR